jgi:hypothetical protein
MSNQYTPILNIAEKTPAYKGDDMDETSDAVADEVEAFGDEDDEDEGFSLV